MISRLRVYAKIWLNKRASCVDKNCDIRNSTEILILKRMVRQIIGPCL